MRNTVYVGTYSHPELFGQDRGFEGLGEGIYELIFDEGTGVLSMTKVHRGILNPSYLAISADGGRLYCVHELETFEGQPGGGITAYRIEEGALHRINAQPTQGAAPCHVAIHPGGGMLCVANYSGGSVSALAIRPDGSLGAPQTVRHAGHGPNAARQDAPHVHSTIFTATGGHAIVADLGSDTLTAYPVEGAKLEGAAQQVPAPPGAGPRACQMALGPNVLYAACELTCKVAAFTCDLSGVPQELRSEIDTLPEHANREGATASDIRISGDGIRLYVSNRGHNSITAFSVREGGTLTFLQNIPSGGLTPRAFTLSPSGQWLLCGNQDSHSIAVFKVDSERGTLTRHSAFEVPSPVCLAFAPV